MPISTAGCLAADLSAKRCDVMVFQMDADILSDRIFQDWVTGNLGYEVVDSGDPMQRGSEIRSIIEIAGDFVELSIREFTAAYPGAGGRIDGGLVRRVFSCVAR